MTLYEASVFLPPAIAMTVIVMRPVSSIIMRHSIITIIRPSIIAIVGHWSINIAGWS